MKITCLHCGRLHALFWYQGTGPRKLCYTCDKYQQHRPNKNTGTPEIRSITKRLVYAEQVDDKKLEGIPTVYSKPSTKKEADEHQKKLELNIPATGPTDR